MEPSSSLLHIKLQKFNNSSYFFHTRSFDCYTKEYTRIRPMRSVVPLNDLGSIDLKLTFVTENVTIRVSPLHATVILYFEKQG